MFERHKLYFSGEGDVNQTIGQYKEVNDFISALRIELYKMTGDRRHLENMVRDYESLVYTRLTCSLNNRAAPARFRDLPASVQEEESRIREAMCQAVNSSEAEKDAVNTYYKHAREWETFLQSLKQNHPAYNAGCYGSLEQHALSAYRPKCPKAFR